MISSHSEYFHATTSYPQQSRTFKQKDQLIISTYGLYQFGTTSSKEERTRVLKLDDLFSAIQIASDENTDEKQSPQ